MHRCMQPPTCRDITHQGDHILEWFGSFIGYSVPGFGNCNWYELNCWWTHCHHLLLFGIISNVCWEATDLSSINNHDPNSSAVAMLSPQIKEHFHVAADNQHTANTYIVCCLYMYHVWNFKTITLLYWTDWTRAEDTMHILCTSQDLTICVHAGVRISYHLCKM